MRCDRGFRLADIADLYSNPLELPFTPEELAKLAAPGDRQEGLSPAPIYEAHAISRRLGPKRIAEAISQYEAGESARSIAARLDVSTSALVNLLRDNAVVVRKRRVSETKARHMAKEYEEGATIRELQKRHDLSQGAVARALHRVGVEMRPRAPRRKP